MSDNVLLEALDAISSRIFSGFNIIESSTGIFRSFDLISWRSKCLKIPYKSNAKQKEGKKVYV